MLRKVFHITCYVIHPELSKGDDTLSTYPGPTQSKIAKSLQVSVIATQPIHTTWLRATTITCN